MTADDYSPGSSIASSPAAPSESQEHPGEQTQLTAQPVQPGFHGSAGAPGYAVGAS
jgi:hypothetical protein